MRIHHIGIEVRNLEASIQFYQILVNLYPCLAFTFMNEKLVFLKGEGVMIELILADDKAIPSSSHIAFQVDDLADLINKLEMRGLMPHEGPYTLENGWTTVFYQGPDQELIEFIQE